MTAPTLPRPLVVVGARTRCLICQEPSDTAECVRCAVEHDMTCRRNEDQ